MNREMIAAFVIGVAFGIWLYKFYIINVLGRYAHTVCDYCEFSRIREELFPKKKRK